MVREGSTMDGWLRMVPCLALAVPWLACTDGPIDEPPYELEPEVVDAARVFDVVELLASDGYGGREPGTEGNDLAVQYVEAVFDDLGLVPAGGEGDFRQHFPYLRWEQFEPAAMELDGVALVDGTDFRPLLHSGSGEIVADVVFGGYGLTVPPFSPGDHPDCPLDAGGYDDYAGLEASGAIVVILRRGPAGDEAIDDHCPLGEDVGGSPWSLGTKAANAVAHGAAAVVVVEDYRHGPDLVDGDLDASGYHEDLPAVTVARDLLEEALPGLPAWAEAIDSTLQPASAEAGFEGAVSVDAAVVEHEIANVLGAVEGSGDEVVVIGAHLDHLGTDPYTGEIYNGADDNASGTAVMLELARLVAGSGVEPVRTVLFAAFNAEEDGLIGSCHYVSLPSYPHEDTVAAISVDMVGAGNAEGITLYGALVEEYLWLAQLADLSVEERGLPYDVIPSLPVLASDHVCFITQDITAVMTQTSGLHDNYHTPVDDIDNVTEDDLAAAAHVMWATLDPLSMAAEEPFLAQDWDPLAE
jgi:hypothetical protein